MLKLSIRSLCLQFFTIVALPQYQAFCSVFPQCSPMLNAVKENYEMWVPDFLACSQCYCCLLMPRACM